MTPPSHSWGARRAARVGIVVSQFPRLSETFVIDQAAALRGAGVDVRVYARRFEESGVLHVRGRELLDVASFAEDARLMRLSRSRFVPGRYRQAVREFAIRHFYRTAARQCDVLLCHFGPVAVHALEQIGGLKRRAPIWTVFHGYDLSAEIQRRGADVYAPLFQQGDRFLPISRFWAARLAELGCPADRIHLLRMGVDCRGIPFAPAAHAAGEPLRILSVGRLVEKKGTEFGLRALGELKAQSPELVWRFDIVGEGPLEPYLRGVAAAAGVRDNVHFLGGRSAEDVRSMLTSAHIFLLPSVAAADGDMEGIPVALMEAMAAGVPVVSTFHSGIPELVDHGVSGLLAPERDVSALAAHIHSLMLHPELRRRLAEAARAKVEAEFDQDVITREFVAFIKAALAG